MSQSEGPIVSGAHVAFGEFLPALLRWRTQPLRLFTSPYDTQRLERLQLSVPAGRRRKVRVHGFPELIAEPNRFPTSVWHAHDSFSGIPFEARRHLKGRFPISMTHHTVSYSNQIHASCLQLLLQDHRASDAIICTSSAAREAIGKRLGWIAESFQRSYGADIGYRGRLEHIPLAVDTELFRPRPRQPLRDAFGLPRDAFVLLWAGRVSASDKADLLPPLQVFRELLRRNPDKKLLWWIVGTGTSAEFDAISDYASALGLSSHVAIVRDLPPSERHHVFAAADVFWSPADNIQETFGLTPIEAMACGIPQVVSDWNGYRDTVVHGETGFRVPTLWGSCDEDIGRLPLSFGVDRVDHLLLSQATAVDVAAQLRYLDQLVRDDELRRTMADISRKRAISEYGWKRMIARYEALWNDLRAHAQRDRSRRPRVPEYHNPRTTQTFGHYATRLLTARDRIAVTPAGQALLAGGDEVLPVYHHGQDLFSVALFEQILRALDAGDPGRPMFMAKVITRFAQGRNPSAARVVRHCLWLIKYGFAATV